MRKRNWCAERMRILAFWIARLIRTNARLFPSENTRSDGMVADV